MADEAVYSDDDWGTESGLLDDYVGTVTRAWFATDAKYNNGETMMLHLEIATTNPDTPEVTEKFPVGGGWDSRDGGATVVHETGKTKFNRSSIYGKIIDSVLRPDGTLHAVMPIIRSRGNQRTAAVWEGLTFHFKEQEFHYGGDIGTKTRVMPVEFLGEGAQPSLPTQQPAAAASVSAPAPAAATVEIDPVVEARLRKAATDATSHQAFLDAAMEIDGVTANDSLMAALVDDSPSGFFASARA